MRRYVKAALTSMTIAGLLSGCGHMSDIGKDRAAEIALADADLTEADVSRLRVTKDRDDGQTIYEVKFTNETTEYEYEILASNGDILSADYDESHSQSSQGQQDKTPQEQTGQQAQADGQKQAGQQAQDDRHLQADVQLTLEEASALALERVPGASEKDLKIELDYDDAYYRYEGDIIYEQKEYEFEIDANTGDFLEWKEERR